MSLMGLPPLDEWDGRVLAEALPGAAGRQIADTGGYDISVSDIGPAGQTYSDEEQEKIRKQLEDLGYL